MVKQAKPGAARAMASRMAQQVVMGRARAAQCVGVGEGARAPVGPARPRVELVELVEPRGDGGRERLTPIGYRTARTALPRVLSDLPDGDPRRLAAGRYADLIELVGAMPCSGLEVSGRGGVSDGGAVRRVGLASELRGMRACLDGVALAVERPGGTRRDIPLRAAVDMVCLQSCEVRAVLRAHGWSVQGAQVKRLSERVLEALMAMSEISG